MKSSRKQNNVVLKNKSKYHSPEEKHSCIINKARLLLLKHFQCFSTLDILCNIRMNNVKFAFEIARK